MQTDLATGQLIPLTVRDFDPSERPDVTSSAADLLRAIPDTLYVYLLANPRLGVTRGPSVPHTTSALAPANGKLVIPLVNQLGGPISKTRGLSYSLEGQVRVVSTATGASTTLGVRGAQLLSVRYQLFGSDPKPILEKSFVAGSGELSERLAEVAHSIADQISPADASVTVFLPEVETSCFPSETENRFYEETLTGLLRTTMLSTDFVNLAKDPAGAYVVRQSAKVDAKGCVVNATLTGLKGETLVADTERGDAADVLDIQKRLNQKIVDALHIESSLTGQKSGVSGGLSVNDYIQAGDKYEQTDPELAAALYRKALTLDSTNKDLANRLAQSLLDANRPQEVVDLIRTPTQISQYQLLASAYLKLGDTIKVDHELNEALRLRSTDRNVYQQAASILEQIGEYEAAANALELGNVYAQEKDGLTAMANETRRRGAKELINAGKDKEALQLALLSLEKEPNSEWGQRLAAIAYIDLQEPEKGEQCLQAAMHIQPTVYSEVELGRMRITQKRYPEARAYAMQAVELDPTYQSGFSVLEDSVKNAQDAAEVTAFLEKYVVMLPPNRGALTSWSFMLTKYEPANAADIHRMYTAYKAATQGVPYTEWVAGWTDLVEIAMLDSHVQEAASLTDSLLAANLPRNDQLNMGFYSWLDYLMLGNCKRFETSLEAWLGALRSGNASDALDGNRWDFTATRKFVSDRGTQGQINTDGMALVTGGMALLENPLTPAKIQQFADLASQSSPKACPAR